MNHVIVSCHGLLLRWKKRAALYGRLSEVVRYLWLFPLAPGWARPHLQPNSQNSIFGRAVLYTANHPEGVVCRGFCLNSSTFAVSEIVSGGGGVWNLSSQIRKVSKWGSQIPEPVLIFTSEHPLKAQISQGLGPSLQIELLKTGRVSALEVIKRKRINIQ